jgi:hypothetical protein
VEWRVASELPPLRQEARSVQLGRRLLADAGRQPDLARPAVGGRARSQDDPLVTARPSGPGSQAPGGTGMSQSGSPVVLTRETGSAGSEMIVPPNDGPAGSGRLPVFDSVESHWFSGGREMPGSPGAAATAAEHFAWSTAADEGWRAAEIVEAPAAGPPTPAGLPRRMPNANLIPGAVPGEQEPAVPNRSAAAARDRLAGFQRGVSKGRAVARETAYSGEDSDS